MYGSGHSQVRTVAIYPAEALLSPASSQRLLFVSVKAQGVIDRTPLQDCLLDAVSDAIPAIA
jgi:hypothetical protein